jgi:hypothetical protein
MDERHRDGRMWTEARQCGWPAGTACRTSAAGQSIDAADGIGPARQLPTATVISVTLELSLTISGLSNYGAERHRCCGSDRYKMSPC